MFIWLVRMSLIFIKNDSNIKDIYFILCNDFFKFK